VSAAWKKDPDGTRAYILGKADPFEQSALVELLAHDDPNAGRQLCDAVPASSPAAERCHKIELRPHLSALPPGEKASGSGRRSGKGPSEAVPLAPTRKLPWKVDSSTPLPSECEGDNKQTCLSDISKKYAAQGDGSTALASCRAAWPDGSAASQECAFQVAEAYGRARGVEDPAGALALCGQSGTLASACTFHVLRLVAPPAPPADQPTQASIDRALKTAAALAEGEDAKVAADHQDFFWANWTLNAFLRADSTTGHLLAAMPAQVAPHIRQAAAWHLLRTGGFPSSMDAGAVALQKALAETGEVAAGPAHDFPSGFDPLVKVGPTLWGKDEGKEAEVDAIWCMALGRRTTSEHPDDELRIVILEAAARQQPAPPSAFFFDVLGTEHADPVRWTAARLGAELYRNEARAMTNRDGLPRIRSTLEARSQTGGPGGR
jgi:hypothetical protein